MPASSPRWNGALAVPGVALLATVAVVALYAVPRWLGVPLFQRLEATSYDLRLHLEARVRPVPQLPELALVEIDDGTLETQGRWPWPRQRLADMVDVLNALGARAVFFDVTFPEPSRESVQTRRGEESFSVVLEQSIRNAWTTAADVSASKSLPSTPVSEVLDRTFRQLHAGLDPYLPAPDTVLSQSLSRARQAGMTTGGVFGMIEPRQLPIVSAAIHDRARALFARDPNPDLSAVPEDVRAYAYRAMNALRREVLQAAVREVVGTHPLDAVDPEALIAAVPDGYQATKLARTMVEQTLAECLLERTHLLRPAGAMPGLPASLDLELPTYTISRAYDALGLDTEVPDPDGYFRSVPLLWRHGDGMVPAAGLAFYLRLVADSGKLPGVSLLPGPVIAVERGRGRPLRIPVSESGQLLINWAGGFESSFAHLPVGALLSYARQVEEREEFFTGFDHSGDYERGLRLREAARARAAARSDSPVNLAELARAAKVETLAAFADVAGVRSPGEWERTLSGWLRAREESLFSGLKRALEMVAAEPDPAKRAERQAKYAAKLAPYEQHVRRVEATRRELEQRVRGKVCIVGHTAASSTDRAPMPFERQYPKVGSYANVINTLLTERFLWRPSWLGWELGGLVDPAYLQLPVLAAVCLVFALVLPGLSSVRGLVWALAFSAVWLIGVAAVLVLAGVWVDAVAPIMGAAITYAIVVTARNRRTERVRSMFESYVDPRIVKVVVEDESLWQELGGIESRITAYFSDIAGFTTLSEMLTAGEVSAMLTDYLSPMTEIILAHDGTRDKYIGDAIVAFFGAPLPAEGHELSACLAAIEQQRRLIELKARWKRDGVAWYAKLQAAGQDLSFRVGLNSGTAKVGNFGSTHSKNYTMIGDTVNLASRLEGANKEYGTLIMATEATIAAHRDKLVTRELDRLVVKGRKEAVRAYEIIGRAGQVASTWPALLELYARALEEYHRREFARARNVLVHLLDQFPDDAPSKVYLERCEQFLVTPPPDDWDGTFTMTHK